MNTRRARLSPVGTLAMTAAWLIMLTSAAAHHSFAMYDCAWGAEPEGWGSHKGAIVNGRPFIRLIVLGCRREARICASRWKRDTRSSSSLKAAGKILIATPRFSFESRAR